MSDSVQIGRTKTVLVFGNNDTPKAVITTLIAQVRSPRSPVKVKFLGELRFAREVAKHIRATVYPAVNDVCHALGMEGRGIELRGINLGAASALDVGVSISGFSADLPVLVAMLSARLQIPVPSDIVLTGHIASPHGEVRLVRNIPAKLKAAVADESVNRFICPALDADRSVWELAKSDYGDMCDALEERRSEIDICKVSDIAEVAPLVFSEYAMVQGALASGYIGRRFPRKGDKRPTSVSARILGSRMRKRFFDLVEAKLLTGSVETARDLIESWVGLYTQRGRYPRHFGRRLRRIVQSLPPAVRRGMRSPLLGVGACIALSQAASEADHDDVLELYRTIVRRERDVNQRATVQLGKQGTCPRGTTGTLNIVTSEIDPDHLCEIIGLPIDAARAAYVLDAPVVESHEELLDIATAFYLHLMRNTGRAEEDAGIEFAGPEALALLDRAFARFGGVSAARAEAIAGTKGGIRLILDRMTEQYKRDRQEDHVRFVLSTAIDPLDWSAKVGFMKEFLTAYPQAVPQELAKEPPERFAGKYETIVQTLVNSMSEVKQVLRSL